MHRLTRTLAFCCLPLLLSACGGFDVSSAHLRSTVPRFTTFSTHAPEVVATCIHDGWAASGQVPMVLAASNPGYTLQSSQKLALIHEKLPMYFIEVLPSREGAAVRFYTNRADEIADRSLISIIQRCE